MGTKYKSIIIIKIFQIRLNPISKKILLFVAGTFLIFFGLQGQTRYWVGGGSGIWSNTNNWSASSGGGSGASVPNGIGFLAIFDGNSGVPNVTVDASYTTGQLWITGNKTVTFISSGGARTLTIGDNTAGNQIVGASVNADFVIESGSTLNITGASAVNTMTVTQNNSANSPAIIVGTIQVNANGILIKAANPTFTFNAGATYNHNQDAGNIVTATWNANSNCVINGTITTAPGGLNQSFGNLNFNCTGLTAPVIMATGAATAVTGQLTITGTSAGNTCSVNPAANSLTVTGTTTINSYGLFIDNNGGGTNTFNGAVTVNANGTISTANNSPYNFNAGLTNSGTITLGGTGAIAFSGGITNSGTISQTAAGAVSFANTQNISGSGTVSLTGAVTVNTGISVTNTSTVSITGALTGGNPASTWINSTNGTLNYGNAASPMGVGILTATANPNLVNYNLANPQNVNGTTYYNLTLSGSGLKTMLAGITVNNNLAISGTATLYTNTFQIIGNATGAFTMAASTGLQLGNVGNNTNVLFPQNYTSVTLDPASTVTYQNNAAQTVANVSYGNLTIAAGGTKTVQDATTVQGLLTINAGTILADGGFTITANGGITNNGTHSGAGEILMSGGSAPHAITGATCAFGNLELNDAANGATFTGTGTTTINGSLIITKGNLTLNAFTTGLAVNGATTIANGGTITMANNTGTKTFTDLLINSGGTYNSTVVQNVTIAGNLQNSGTLTPNTGTYTLSGAAKQISGTVAISIPNLTITGTYTNNNSSLTVGTLLTVTAPGTLTNGTGNSVTATTSLAGTGSFIQGTNSVLYIGGTSGITTLTATANGNTVDYNSTTAAQGIKAVPYYNLVIDKAGQIGTLAAATSVSGNLSINNGTLADGGFALTVNGNVINNGLHTGAGSITLSGGSAAHNISGTGSFQNVVLNDLTYGATLGSATAINGTLTFTNGLFYLNNYNLSMATAAAAIGGAPSSSNMVVINGSGQMQKWFAVGASAFTYPIGDNSGNFTPVALTFTANATAGLFGVKVTNAKHPANVQINNYLKRYWSFTAPATTGYTYSATFQYTAPDVVGSEAYMLDQIYNSSTWTTDVGSSTNTGTHILSTGSGLTYNLSNTDFTAFNGGTNLYYWSKATGNWSAPGTWEVTTTPANPGVNHGTPATTAPTNLNSSGITIRGSGLYNVTLNNSYTVDSLNINGTLTIPAGQTLTVANGGYSPDMVVNTTGVVTNSGTIVPTGTISFLGSATYNHTQNGGTIPTATWAATSNCNITFGASATLNGLSQSFGNVTYTTAGAFTMTLGQSPTIQGNLTINGATGTFAIAANTVNLTGNLSGNGIISLTTGTLNIGGNNTSTGTFTAGTGTINYNGTNQIVRSMNGANSYYNLQISNGGTKQFSNAAVNIGGNLNVFSGSTLAFTNGAAAQTVTLVGNLNSTAGTTGTIDMSPNGLVNTLLLGGATNAIGTLTTGAALNIVTYTLAGSQTVFASPNYRVLNINGGAGTKTLQGNITVNNNLSVAATTTFNLGTVASIINVGGSATITGSLIFGNTTDKTMTVTGILSMNNASSLVDMSGSPNHALYLRGNFNVFTAGGTFTAGAGNQTVYYDGDQAQTLLGVTYNNLYVGDYNPAAPAATIKTLGGATTVNGTLNVTGVASTPTVTLQLAAQNLTVNGATNVNAYGILNDNALAGVNTFVGLVTINANGQWLWTSNSAITFEGGLTNNGSNFTSGTGNYTFTTNNQYISGNTSFVITNNLVTTGITVTNRNTGGLTVGSITGTGNFTNGDVGYNAMLFLTGAGNPLALTGTINFASNPNTVNYQAGAAVAQTIGAYNFYNLSISGTRTTASITLANGGTIGIFGTFNLTATFTSGNYIVLNNTINFNGTSAQNINPPPPSGSNPYNNVTISGGSTKTLTGAITMPATGVLNLNSGVLELNNSNLTVNNNAANAIQGSFSATNMIATDGTGYLIKNGASAQALYPIGSNGYYSPFTLTAFLPAGGTFSVRAVPASINPSYIKVWWDVIPSNVITSATATFQYDPAEANGASPNMTYSPDGGVTWQSPPTTGTPSYGANSFTITGTAPFKGWWTMGFRSFYSYQTGDWNAVSTWTTDPSGTLQIGNSIPGYNDNVVILSGRTVSISSNILTQKLSININAGGYLNLEEYQFSNGILVLSGQGTLQISPSNPATGYFPTVTTNTFINAGGGTTEYDTTTNLPSTTTTYNNLCINASGTVTQTWLLSNSITLNGNLHVEQGTFQINDNSTAQRLQLTINGSIIVDSTGSIAVGTGNTVTGGNTPTTVPNGGAAPFINYYNNETHSIIVLGNFTNNGTVRFTNQAYPQYNAFPANGAATVYFRGTSNDTLTCNGQTDFYNLVLDKGSDATYSLTINPSAYSNFRLFGANVAVYYGATPNPNIQKALWIRYGNLILTGFTVIPSLSEGAIAYPTTPTSDYYIPAGAELTIGSGNVIVLSTADDYSEVNAAYGISGGSNAAYGIGAGGGSGLAVLGKLQVNSGYLSTRESSGLLYWSYNLGQIMINGGTIDAKQIHSPEAANAGLVNYSQNNGTVILRGRFQNTINYSVPTDLANPAINYTRAANSIDANVGTFYINSNASNGFSMSGGTINIYDVCGTPATPYAFQQNSPASNCNVSGGTLQIIPKATGLNDANYYIYSTTPVGNLTISPISGATQSVQLNTNALTVLNNISLQTGSTFIANGLDLNIGGNFTIANNAVYTTGANRTLFNGSGNQTFTVNTAGALALNKLIINKAANKALLFAGSQSAINLADSLMIIGGQLGDNGDTIKASGGVYNAGTEYGTGKIAMVGTTAQTIDGNGSGIFTNLDLNNTNAGASPVSITSNITVTGALKLVSNKIFVIGSNNLNVTATGTITSTPGFGANCYIQSSGLSGDGGITKTYSASSKSFTFPIGAPTITPVKATAYTPATINIASATTWGSITLRPVGIEQPATTTKGHNLTYYWRVKSTGFAGYANSVTHKYTYNPADVPVLADTSNYVPARYDESAFTWTSGAHSSFYTNLTLLDGPWLNNTSNIDGDYTAGLAADFGTPKVFYSRQNGLWNTLATWSLTSHTVTNPPAAPPGINDIVLIGNNDSVFLTNAAYGKNVTIVKCASLQIDAGSALDIDNNPGSVFSVVVNNPLGNGNFRMSTTKAPGGAADTSKFYFPSGDFTDFNTNKGTEEFYTTTNDGNALYVLPSVASFGNMKLSPLGGDNLALPNLSSVTIYGNLSINGSAYNSATGISWSTNTANNYYPNCRWFYRSIEKTVHIYGNLNVNGGSFMFWDDSLPQHLIVDGDVNIASTNGACFLVYDAWYGVTPYNSGSTVVNTLAIGGNINNNGTTNGKFTGLTLVTGNVPIHYCDVTFQGSGYKVITGTGNNSFHNVTVNKGSSQATTLTCNTTGTLTTLADNWLTLTNGTFIYNRAGTAFNITTTSSFTIPATAGLTIANAANVNIAQGNVSTNTLYLSGKLTSASTNAGNINIGLATNNQHNDIEYSSGGAATIEVDGGNLIVNGAIRRNPSNSAGVLNFTQTGGQVTINGNTALTSNAKLEVVNTGSQFNMSGGTLTIVRGGGINYGDLYLRPQSSSVTGGAIVFSQGALPVTPSYLLDANIPLNNVTITGAAGHVATVGLMVDPLNVNGTLLLSNVNSVLTSNNLNLTVGGDFNNSGTYNYGTNLTTFDGGTQNITGSSVTNFYDLNISPVTSVTENSNATVNHNLTIGNGIFVLGNYLVTMLGNLTNNGSYIDNNTASSGISLSGTSQQIISGTGSFGRLEVKNNAGALANNDLDLRNNLALTKRKPEYRFAFAFSRA